jgi:hypothetical protein
MSYSTAGNNLGQVSTVDIEAITALYVDSVAAYVNAQAHARQPDAGTVALPVGEGAGLRLTRRLSVDETKAIELVRTLSVTSEYNNKPIIALCERWNVPAKIVYPSNGGRLYYDIPETIKRLARHIAGVPEPVEEDE